MARKEILIVAGPNGAGKTTFAHMYLELSARRMPFVNADGIAPDLPSGTALHADYRAGRLMLAGLDRLAAEGRSFAFETTLSGRGYLRRIRQWRDHGYDVTLLFRSLPSAEDAVERVSLRASQGGHEVPDDVVRQRFEKGLRNFRELYREAVDEWMLFDGLHFSPVPIARGTDLATHVISTAPQH